MTKRKLKYDIVQYDEIWIYDIFLYQLGGYLKKTGTHSILLNTYWWNNVTKTGIYRIYQMKYKQITYCRK